MRVASGIEDASVNVCQGADIGIALCKQVHGALTNPAIGCRGFSGLAAMAGNIFISYRRDDSGGMAGRLHDRMAETFGKNKLFMDVDNIPVGRDFEEYLRSQVAACDAMLAVIGPKWLDVKDDTGQRRLDNPEDFVRAEIAAALARNIPLIPVLIDGARVPKASDLPDPLKPLARRQGFEVRHANFGRDAGALAEKLQEVVGHRKFGPGWLPLAWRMPLVAVVIGLVAGLTWLLNDFSRHQEISSPVHVPDAPTTSPAPEKSATAPAQSIVGTWRSADRRFVWKFVDNETYTYLGSIITAGMDTESSETGTYTLIEDKLVIQRLSGGLTSSNNYKQKLDPANQIYHFRLDGQTLYLTYPNGGDQAFYRLSQ
jgi:hypothetical protein